MCVLPIVIVCQRGHLVEGRGAAAAPFSEDARRIAVLLDQLDLDRPGLCDGDLDLDRADLAAVVRLLSDDGQHVEGSDAEHSHPRAAAVKTSSTT